MNLEFRYGSKQTETAILESEFAELIGSRYAIAVNSCSSAMFLALKAAGVGLGDFVFVPAFTFIAVPSAIIHAGAIPILVEVDENFALDLYDLRQKISDMPHVKVLLLSYMRGRLPNLDELFELATQKGLHVIEDAAHSLGGEWRGRQIGSFGVAGCYSTQSFKIIKSGEGGLVVTNDGLSAAKMILMSGAFDETWKLHVSRPKDELFELLRGKVPCFGMRMTNSVAKQIRTQLPMLESRVLEYRQRHAQIESTLIGLPYLSVPKSLDEHLDVGDTVLFSIKTDNNLLLQTIYDELFLIDRSVVWYGNEKRFNSRVFTNWQFMDKQDCPRTAEMLQRLFEFKIDLLYQIEHYDRMASILEVLLKK